MNTSTMSDTNPSTATTCTAHRVTLYRHPISGHCHRVELFLSLLGRPVELIHVDLTNKAQKSADFLAMNPFGQIPVLKDGDVIIADANAILVYLATKYAPDSWLPLDPVKAAEVQRWLSVAAGLLAFGPASARLAVLFNAPVDVAQVTARSESLFTVMEQILATRHFLTGSTPTLADIANYSYIAHAPEGNLSLSAYPNLRAWLVRIESLPGFVPMMNSPVGLRV